MTSPRIGSLCTGYGGLDMGVQEALGGELAWVADNDPGAARIITHHWPNIPNLGDLTTVQWDQVAPVDILCGGYPCQPFSTAGHRKGTDDARHIWPHIATALGVLRPRLAVFENVAGHLSLGFDTVLADLARLGFDAEWCCIRASEIGAAHQRNRLFLLAWPADTQGPGQSGQGLLGRTPERSRDAAAHPIDIRSNRDRARGTGRNELAARHLAAAHPAGLSEREPADKANSLAGGGDAREVPRRGNVLTAPDIAWGDYEPAIRRWERILGRPAPRPVDDLGRLSPAFVEWVMGLDAGHVTDVPELSRTAQLKALGNGVVPQQAEAGIRLLMTRIHGTEAPRMTPNAPALPLHTPYTSVTPERTTA